MDRGKQKIAKEPIIAARIVNKRQRKEKPGRIEKKIVLWDKGDLSGYPGIRGIRWAGIK